MFHPDWFGFVFQQCLQFSKRDQNENLANFSQQGGTYNIQKNQSHLVLKAEGIWSNKEKQKYKRWYWVYPKIRVSLNSCAVSLSMFFTCSPSPPPSVWRSVQRSVSWSRWTIRKKQIAAGLVGWQKTCSNRVKRVNQAFPIAGPALHRWQLRELVALTYHQPYVN